MAWTERQHRMLAEMGVRLWQPPGSDASATDAVAAEVAVDDARPAPSPVAALVVREPSAPAMAVPAAAPATRSTSSPSDTWAPAHGLDWPALRQVVQSCQACGLARTRTQTVFGVGHARAEWMIVGEAPGEQEDLRGEPFVGAAGRLLDRMLASLGLTRDESDGAHQVYIANTLKCRPPRNRNPEPDELSRCLPFLECQVQLVQPRVILAMGRFAVQALLDTQEPIGRLRGRVHQWHGCPVVVTYHPAYLLRQPTEKARAWADLCLAAEVHGAGQGH